MEEKKKIIQTDGNFFEDLKEREKRILSKTPEAEEALKLLEEEEKELEKEEEE